MTTSPGLAGSRPLAGSTVVITGASSGIGRSAAGVFASLGARIIMVGRSPEKHRAVEAELEAEGAEHELVAADLGVLSSVAGAGHVIAESATRRGEGGLFLVNNAATAGRRGVTRDGFELAFGVNYLAHFLLTSLLLEAKLPISGVVNVTSNAHYSTATLDPGLAMGRTRSLMGWREYSHSKAALAAFTVELAHRHPAIRSLAVHPGVVATGLWRRIPQPFRALATRRMAPPAAGALPLVRAVVDSSLQSGGYLAPEGIRAPGAAVLDAAGRSRLWDASRRWVEPFLHPSAATPGGFGQ